MLVIIATALVIIEGLITRRQLHAELLDVPELARKMGQRSGYIKDADRQRRSVAG